MEAKAIIPASSDVNILSEEKTTSQDSLEQAGMQFPKEKAGSCCSLLQTAAGVSPGACHQTGVHNEGWLLWLQHTPLPPSLPTDTHTCYNTSQHSCAHAPRECTQEESCLDTREGPRGHHLASCSTVVSMSQGNYSMLQS